MHGRAHTLRHSHLSGVTHTLFVVPTSWELLYVTVTLKVSIIKNWDFKIKQFFTYVNVIFGNLVTRSSGTSRNLSFDLLDSSSSSDDDSSDEAMLPVSSSKSSSL